MLKAALRVLIFVMFLFQSGVVAHFLGQTSGDPLEIQARRKYYSGNIRPEGLNVPQMWADGLSNCGGMAWDIFHSTFYSGSERLSDLSARLPVRLVRPNLDAFDFGPANPKSNLGPG